MRILNDSRVGLCTAGLGKWVRPGPPFSARDFLEEQFKSDMWPAWLGSLMTGGRPIFFVRLVLSHSRLGVAWVGTQAPFP